jgi:ATP-binding cassette subfamily B protein
MNDESVKEVTSRDVIKSYWKVLKKHRRLVFLDIFFLTLIAITEILSPIYIKNFFDTIAKYPQIPISMAYQVLYGIIIVLLLRYIFRRFGAICYRTLMAYMSSSLSYHSFLQVINHSDTLFSSQLSGTLAHKASKYNSAFRTLFDNFGWNIYPSFLRAIGFIIVLFYFSPAIGVLVFAWIVFYTLANFWFIRQTKEIREKITKRISQINGRISDNFLNQMNIKLFNRFNYEKNRMKDEVKILEREELLRARAGLNFYALHALIIIVIEIAIFFIGLHYFKNGLVAVGFFYLAYTYIVKISDDLWYMSTYLEQIIVAFSDAKDSIALMNKESDIIDPKIVLTPKERRGEITYNNVSFTYTNHIDPALSQVSLKITAKEKIALIGGSGAGKSTFVKLLFRLLDVNDGSIKIDDVDVRDMSLEALRGYISFVPQEPILFHRSIFENISYGKEGATYDEVVEASKKARCHDFISKLLGGYESEVGERGVKLSGGEKQRIAIARAILKDSPILVLDEATSALDSESEKLIQDALKELMKNKTVIIIAHRLSTIKHLKRIVVLDGGRVIEDGSHDELLANNSGVYKKLWELQFGGFID